MIDTVLADGVGQGHKACVTPHQALCVAQVVPEPPATGSASRFRYLTGLLGTTGLDSGVTNQNGNGAVTPIEFFVQSNEDYDIRIMAASIVIADANNVPHNNFGNIGPLAVGWDLKIEEAGETTFLLDKVKTNGQVIVHSGSARPYGDAANSFIMVNWTVNDNAITAYIPFNEYIPGGLRIGRGTLDRFSSVVNDAHAGITEMFVRIFGYRHYP